MPKLLILNGHPNPDSFSASLSHAYEVSARDGAEVQRIDLRDLRFDPILHRGYAAPQELEPDLARAAQAIVEASHVAWFFPCWWNAPPALVKGFVDRVFTPGFAFRYSARSKLPQKLLSGRSARLVSSMDAPRFWQVLVNRSALETSFTRSTLGFVGFAPVHTNIYYGAHGMSARDRQRALDDMRKLAQRDARKLLHMRLPAPMSDEQLSGSRSPRRSAQ
jgi:putative NADPH-quinone reductase